MAKWHTRWTVRPHGPLRSLADNLRVVEQALPDMPLSRRMSVIRLADGRLVVHSAIALEEPSMQALEGWGEMAFLVVPNSYHRLDALIWKQRYPALRVIAGPTGARKIAAAVPVDGGPELIPGGLGLYGENLAGNKVGEMAFLVDHGTGKTLLVNDAFFNEPHKPGLTGFLFRLFGSTGGLKVTRIMKLFGTSDQAAFLAHLRRLAETPGLLRLVMSHGVIVEDDVAARLRQALA